MIRLSILSIALISAFSTLAQQQDLNTGADVEHVLVVGQALSSPVTVETDARAPRQPLPAHDGADYLKTLPGFSVTRKGGIDGDPLFRGMAGSRLGILVDGENILGGCNMRMDTPTAYIYPQLHDTVTVIKGPQSVRFGAGHSAATVIFERSPERFTEPGYKLHASALVASNARHDELVDLTIGNTSGYLLLNGSHSEANNYKDGDGNAVHSAYQRYSANVAAGWTPDETSLLELSLTRSDGEAAYADRSMDGTQFLRESVNLRAEKTNLTSWLNELKLHLFDNSVDHIMDDQQLRPAGMMGYANVKRDTHGGRVSAELTAVKDLTVLLGIDQQVNTHHTRYAPPSGVYGAEQEDARIRQFGLFTELELILDQHHSLHAGYRLDDWQARDKRDVIVGMMMPRPNPTAQQQRSDTLHSAFLRLEQTLSARSTLWYIGIGHTGRFADYWELIAKESATSLSGFNIRPEKTTQLDSGLLYKKGNTEFSASVFYNQVDDFILVNYTNPMKRNGYVENVDSKSFGGELSISYNLTKQLKVNSALSYVKATNRTDNQPLPQIAPLEWRSSLTYSQNNWSVGGLMRVVDAQHRFTIDKGNIVGKDLGSSSGFAIFSLNANWQLSEALRLTGGIDNLFDRNYAEFVSRAGGNGMGGAIAGYIQTERVNEPGRTLWLQLQLSM